MGFVNLMFIYCISQKAPVSLVKIIRSFFLVMGHCGQYKPIQSVLYSCIAKSFPTFFRKLKESYEALGPEGQGLTLMNRNVGKLCLYNT